MEVPALARVSVELQPSQQVLESVLSEDGVVCIHTPFFFIHDCLLIDCLISGEISIVSTAAKKRALIDDHGH